MKLILLVFAVCTTTTLVVSAHPQNKILDHPRSKGASASSTLEERYPPNSPEALSDDDNDEATLLG